MDVSTPLYIDLPYQEDTATLFEVVVDWPWSMFLDSGGTDSERGRYDILSADPMITIVTRNNITEVTTRDRVLQTETDPLEVLREQLSGCRIDCDKSLPFNGGAIGYCAYDLGRRWERLAWRLEPEVPDLAFGIYDWFVLVDHSERRTTLARLGKDDYTGQFWNRLVRSLGRVSSSQDANKRRSASSEIRSSMSFDVYASAFRRIKQYIRNGDCYQVNLTQKFTAQTDRLPWDLYREFRCRSPAPHGAFMNFPQFQILSASPERFLQLRAGKVVTQPIKGTRPRGSDKKTDHSLKTALANSEKDLAENVMIVDLLRNDLGKVCRIGSVKVPLLFELQSFANVHHLVSTIEGELAHGKDAIDLLRACLPGGSITGAPKLRAMEIIDELEPHNRGVYCGCIGYIGFNGEMDTNISIRTMVCQDYQVSFWAGGGIVADSDLDAEYQECFDKASAMLGVLKGEV